ncbi:MAG: carbohydrate kinase, partial [Clostridia bacterium]|nr:carbohydrate kinase [Clostridia bacterium]
MFIGGLDVGTTGCKLSVYDDKGNFIDNSYREYEVSRKSGSHEVDPDMIFAAVCEVISDIAKKYDLAAFGVTSFGESFAILDENDKVLLPAMLYTDPRGEEEVRSLCEKLTEEKIVKIAGLKPHQMYSLPKIMWIKNNLPDVFAKAKRILLIEDYIIYRLSGVAQMDYSLAARTMAFDIKNKCWSKEILSAAGVDEALLSKPVPAGSIAGDILPAMSEKLGLNKETKIINSAHDQVASAIGCGVFEA